MKHIEDADEQKEFDKAVHAFNDEKNHFKTWREECAFFFIAGRESMAKEFWTARPKRTISRVIVGSQGNLFALSSDGRLYGLREFDGTNLPEWLPYAELPQGD